MTVTHTLSPIVSSGDYYPFGLTFNSYRRENSLDQLYRFNGKELHDEVGIEWYDYGARMYMSDIGRWGATDPLGSLLPSWSPYAYAFNSPVVYTDPDGRFPSMRIGPGSGNHWSDGMGYSDWTSNGGSEMYRQAKGMGAMSLGRHQYVQRDGEYKRLSSWNGQLGYWDLSTWLGWDPWGSDGIAINTKETFVFMGGDAQQGAHAALETPYPNRSDWTNAGAGIMSVFGGGGEIARYQLTKGGKMVPLASKGAYLGVKAFSNTLGAANLAVTGYQIYDKGLNTGNALDAAFGVIAFVPGFGWAVSGTYFVANLVTIGVTGQSIGDHIQGAITGQDGTKSWKPWGDQY